MQNVPSAPAPGGSQLVLDASLAVSFASPEALELLAGADVVGRAFPLLGPVQGLPAEGEPACERTGIWSGPDGPVELRCRVQAFRVGAEKAYLVDLAGPVGTGSGPSTESDVTAFVSALSHELRTPLNAMLGFAQLLELEDLSTSQGEAVQQILASGNHLSALVSDTLDVTRLQAGNLPMDLEHGDIVEICQAVLALLGNDAAARACRLTLQSPATVLAVTDRRRLRQVVLNLVGNALKYGSEGGLIEVVVREAVGEVCIDVRDHGPGMTEQEAATVLLPFQRLARHAGQPGAGLGLALTSRLAESMGGRLTLTAAPGQGCTFTVGLRPGTPRRAAPTSWARDGEQRGDVLYVEDNEVNVRLVQRVLQRRPHVRLHVVNTLSQAQEAMRDTYFDAILLDLQLPDGRGDALFATQPGRHEPKAFIVLSGDRPSTEDQVALARLGHLFLSKPLDIEQLLASVDEVLSRPMSTARRRGSAAVL